MNERDDIIERCVAIALNGNEPFLSEGWVIPHHTPLDYCHVRVVGERRDGRLRVTGIRNRGWNPDGAEVKCSIRPDRLTSIDSDHPDFLQLDYDPCPPSERPRNKPRWEIMQERRAAEMVDA